MRKRRAEDESRAEFDNMSVLLLYGCKVRGTRQHSSQREGSRFQTQSWCELEAYVFMNTGMVTLGFQAYGWRAQARLARDV